MSIVDQLLIRTLEQSPKIVEGLKSGLYEIFGGVVRIAKGNPKGGQIVTHLKFPNDMSKVKESIDNMLGTISLKIDNLQVTTSVLQESMSTLQKLQYANIAMSGLNLVVSAIGFAVISKKLSSIEEKLNIQSQHINQIINKLDAIEQKDRFRDTARFIAHIESVQQFIEMKEIVQLKNLLPSIKEQYHYTRQLLLGIADSVYEENNVFVKYLDEVSMLQERFMWLGITICRIQQEIGATDFALKDLQKLQKDWQEFIEKIESTLMQDKEIVYKLYKKDVEKLFDLLMYRKKIQPALEYQESILNIAKQHPKLLNIINEESSDILLITF